MTPVEAGLAVWAFAALLILLLAVFVRRWRGKHVPEVREARLERSKEHLQQLNAYHDWMRDPAIVKVILRKGLATPEGLQGIEGAIDGWPEDRVFAAVTLLLADREVRIAIASSMERRFPHLRGKRPVVMQNLLRWTKPELVDHLDFDPELTK